MKHILDLGFFVIQVANAARMNASAVLIYPDPSDYSIKEHTELYGHVSDAPDARSVRLDEITEQCNTIIWVSLNLLVSHAQICYDHEVDTFGCFATSCREMTSTSR